MIKKILTGCKCIDRNLGGGISPGSVTLIYGEPETGKSTLAMQCAVNCAMQGFKTLFVDCDNTFSAKRLSQLSSNNFDKIAELIILLRPVDFKEQAVVVDSISDYTAKNFGLVIIDTLTSLYGAKVSQSEGKKGFEVNRELNRQLAILAQTAAIRKIPFVITSQVRSVFNDSSVSIAPVASRVLKFWADNIINMEQTENPQTIKAVVEKPSQNLKESTCYVQIGESGISDTELY